MVLRTLGARVDLAEVQPFELPLPARRQDVDDAFATFRGGVVRRGESTITLRRLLRLLGSERRTDALVTKISRAFQADGIRASVDPGEADLDQRMVLTAHAPAAAPAAPAVVSGSRASLVAALRRLARGATASSRAATRRRSRTSRSSG